MDITSKYGRMNTPGEIYITNVAEECASQANVDEGMYVNSKRCERNTCHEQMSQE
jgi:hypothetical protein